MLLAHFANDKMPSMRKSSHKDTPNARYAGIEDLFAPTTAHVNLRYTDTSGAHATQRNATQRNAARPDKNDLARTMCGREEDWLTRIRT